MINYYEDILRRMWLSIRDSNDITYQEWRKNISKRVSQNKYSNIKSFNDKELVLLLRDVLGGIYVQF
ncbi:hypothetical protein JJB71_12735 [Clostridium perfringens]|uniref:hypothetical protein n=1 Tax=Clostridium perfringens TaxID=1502 RepID=UPI001ABA5E4C|nr:hypothetical protein [Clostridium perfringens]MBO3398406.1 hypothetical protein [Clostridium perfringens]